MVVEWLVPMVAVLVMCLGPLLLLVRGFARALSLDSAMQELHSVKAARKWEPTELEAATSRLRVARRRRRELELSSWEASFSALVVARGGCPVCAGRAHR